jgi:hypothetical protein
MHEIPNDWPDAKLSAIIIAPTGKAAIFVIASEAKQSSAAE